MPGRRRGGVVLLSGGMDSATCLAIAAREVRELHALSVRYGQRHARELRSARALARHFDVEEHTVVRVEGEGLFVSALTDRRQSLPDRAEVRSDRIPATYVPARNTVMLALALAYAESHRLDRIYIGANAVDYSGYPDCRPEYFRSFNRLAERATRAGVETGRAPSVRAPLLRLSKAEIVRLGEKLSVPWRLTWSCYSGERAPCGRCDACRLRARGFADANVQDPLVDRRTRRSRRPAV